MLAIIVGPIKPGDGPVLVSSVEIPQGDAIGTAILGLFMPCRLDVGDGPLRTVVSAFCMLLVLTGLGYRGSFIFSAKAWKRGSERKGTYAGLSLNQGR